MSTYGSSFWKAVAIGLLLIIGLGGGLVAGVVLNQGNSSGQTAGTPTAGPAPSNPFGLTATPAMTWDSNEWVLSLVPQQAFAITATQKLDWTVSWNSTVISDTSVALKTGFTTPNTYAIVVSNGTLIDRIRVDVKDPAGRSGPAPSAMPTNTPAPTATTTPTAGPTNTPTPTVTATPDNRALPTTVAGADFEAIGLEKLPDGWYRLTEATNRSFCAWSFQFKLELDPGLTAQWDQCVRLSITGIGTAKLWVRPDNVGYKTSDTLATGLAWWPVGIGEYSILTDESTMTWTGWMALTTGPEGINFPATGGERRMEFRSTDSSPLFVSIPLGEIRNNVLPKY